MPSEQWTASKVAQIAQLTKERDELKARCQALVDESWGLRQELTVATRVRDELTVKLGEEYAKTMKLEAALKEASDHLRAVWECAQDGVCKRCGVKGYD